MRKPQSVNFACRLNMIQFWIKRVRDCCEIWFGVVGNKGVAREKRVYSSIAWVKTIWLWVIPQEMGVRRWEYSRITLCPKNQPWFEKEKDHQCSWRKQIAQDLVERSLGWTRFPSQSKESFLRLLINQ